MKSKLNGLRIALVKLLKRLLTGINFRGKGTILSILCPRNEVITLDLFGYAFDCDLSEHLQRIIFLYNYDEKAMRFIQKHLKPGDVFLDIGANVGFYSLLAASLVGESGKVIAIEPNPAIHAKLKRTIERNGIKNILLLNIGLGKENGFLDLFINPKSGIDTATMVADGVSESIRVEVFPLDTVALTHHFDSITYLKIDVDGFEPDIFAGARRLLAEGKIDYIQSEFCDYWLRKNGSSPDALHRLLTDAGFEDVEGTPHFPNDCLVDRILARRKS